MSCSIVIILLIVIIVLIAITVTIVIIVISVIIVIIVIMSSFSEKTHLLLKEMVANVVQYNDVNKVANNDKSLIQLCKSTSQAPEPISGCL